MIYKQLPYNKINVERFKSKDNLLKHARTGKNIEGVFFVTIKEELIGYIGWEGDWIIALEVAPSYRFQGFGGKLLDIALKNGCTKLSVNSKNLGAINLYKSKGFITAEDNGKQKIMVLEKRFSLIVKRKTGKVENLIFVSTKSGLEKEIIDPVIPSDFLVHHKYINWQLPRIKLYTNLSDALSGQYLDQNIEGKTIYVYQASGIRNESLIKPGLSDCPYELLVDEYWYLANLRLKFITSIKIIGLGEEESYKYGPRQLVAKLKRWKWKEILKPWEKNKLGD